MASILASRELRLVLVILVLMASLTFGSKSTPIPDRQVLDAAAQVEVTATEIRVSQLGEKTVYRVADGYTYVEQFGSKQIQRKERVSLAAGDKVEPLMEKAAGATEASQVGVRVVFASGGGREFRADRGWELVESEGAAGAAPARAIERHPLVNTFFNRDNLINLGTYAAFIAIMAVGMTGIIVMGGIDLSVGSIYGLAAVGGAFFLNWLQANHPDLPWIITVPAGVLVCCAIGAACGLVNGFGTVMGAVHPFIITLGGMAVYRGISFLISEGQTIGSLPPSYLNAIKVQAGGVNPVPTAVMILVAVIGAFVAARTVFGRQIFAIGGNETAAKYAGIRVGAVKIWMFVLMGLLAGLSAGLIIGHLGGGSSAAGQGYELDVIAATVVGGVSLAGGRGSVLGAVLGAIIIQMINNGFNVLGFDQNYRQIVIGLAIVVAVLIDQGTFWRVVVWVRRMTGTAS